MKNPKWHRDEIILALDLYYKLNHTNITASNSEVIKLSIILNSMNLPVERNDAEKYRNPNGVSLKLSNFTAIDPDYTGEACKTTVNLMRRFSMSLKIIRKSCKKKLIEYLKVVLNSNFVELINNIMESGILEFYKKFGGKEIYCSANPESGTISIFAGKVNAQLGEKVKFINLFKDFIEVEGPGKKYLINISHINTIQIFE